MTIASMLPMGELTNPGQMRLAQGFEIARRQQPRERPDGHGADQGRGVVQAGWPETVRRVRSNATPGSAQRPITTPGTAATSVSSDSAAFAVSRSLRAPTTCARAAPASRGYLPAKQVRPMR